MTSRSYLLTTALTALIGAIAVVPARAQIVLDPLHGFCDTVSCADLTVSGNTVTTGVGFNGSDWGFNISGSTGPATFNLIFALPNNATQPANIAVKGTIGATSVSLTATSLAGWTSGDIGAVPAVMTAMPGGLTPTNPFNNFIGFTQSVDAGATGYDLFLASRPNTLLSANPASGSGTMDLSATLPEGSMILAFFNNNPDPQHAWAATASSGVLFDDTDAPPDAPEPASIALLSVGLLGLGAIKARKRG